MENNAVKTGHPKGLYFLFFTEMWERFSYYGMRAIFILFMTKVLLMKDADASEIYGSYTGLVYLTPLLGGYLCDKFLGNRRSIVIGGLLMAIGQFFMFFSASVGANGGVSLMWMGLTAIIIGNGFFKPNISTIVGHLYPDGDKRKDSAFTIFYMGINAGSFLAPLICGTLAEKTMATEKAGEIIHYGFRYGFLVAGLGMILGQIIFNGFSNRFLGDIGKLPVGVNKSNSNKKIETKPLTKKEKHRTVVILLLTAFVVVFWTGFEQAGSSLTIYTEDFINRSVNGWEVPVSWFQSLNPLFILILGIPISKLWYKLACSKNGDLSIPQKMAIGSIMLGLGFLLMVGAVMERGGNVADTTIKANMIWLVGTYFLHTVGELCLSPVGLSMVSQLAPAKLASFLMGVWLLSSFAANQIAGVLARFTETLGHLEIFAGIAAVAIVMGLILLSFNKKLVAMME